MSWEAAAILFLLLAGPAAAGGYVGWAIGTILELHIEEMRAKRKDRRG